MTEVSARVSFTDGTATYFVERALVVYPFRVLDIQLAARRERLSGAAIARRQNAVKHIDAARNCFHQILGRADAHQVSRRVFRHSRRDVFNYFKHQRLLFSDAQSADGVAVEADVYGLFETRAP